MMKIFRELLPQETRDAWAEWALKRNAAKHKEIFQCNALAGESDFNICINSDMTVSCNCQDFDGQGRIGDLKAQTLEEIFSGPVAHRFRATLAAGKFPLPTCAHCADLRRVSRTEVDACLTRYRVPYKGIMVENTALCNLLCHMCNREKLLGIRSGKHSLTLDDVDRIGRMLEEYGIKSLLYFNLGEPFLPPDILEQMRIIRSHNPDIRIITSTNGQLLNTPEKVEAALLMDYIYVSLDGVDQETVGKYQVGGTFETAYQNMMQLVSERKRRRSTFPIIEWKYVVFRWNDHPRHITKALEFAREAGIDVMGYYRGDVRLVDRSLRWYFHPAFKKLGTKKNDGIVVNLNNIPSHLLSP